MHACSPALETVLLSAAAGAPGPPSPARGWSWCKSSHLGVHSFPYRLLCKWEKESIESQTKPPQESGRGRCVFAQKPALVTNQPRRMVTSRMHRFLPAVQPPQKAPVWNPAGLQCLPVLVTGKGQAWSPYSEAIHLLWAGQGSLKGVMKRGPAQNPSDSQPQQGLGTWAPMAVTAFVTSSLHFTVSSCIRGECRGQEKSHQLPLEMASLVFSFPFGCLLK